MFYVLVYMYTLSSRVLSPHIKYTQISTIIMYYYIVLYIHVYTYRYIYIHIANQLFHSWDYKHLLCIVQRGDNCVHRISFMRKARIICCWSFRCLHTFTDDIATDFLGVETRILRSWVQRFAILMANNTQGSVT